MHTLPRERTPPHVSAPSLQRRSVEPCRAANATPPRWRRRMWDWGRCNWGWGSTSGGLQLGRISVVFDLCGRSPWPGEDGWPQDLLVEVLVLCGVSHGGGQARCHGVASAHDGGRGHGGGQVRSDTVAGGRRATGLGEAATLERWGRYWKLGIDRGGEGRLKKSWCVGPAKFRNKCCS
jgi:hypothetical protein